VKMQYFPGAFCWFTLARKVRMLSGELRYRSPWGCRRSNPSSRRLERPDR
jgi:hypothetical protein